MNSGGGENTVGGVAGRPASTSTSEEETARISSEGSKASLEGEEGRMNGVGGGWSMGSVLKAAELSWGRVFTGVGVLNLGGGVFTGVELLNSGGG